MRRGTEVGRGYVALEINGDGMNEDIVDAVDSAGPGVERVGKEHGDRYGDGFEGGFFSRLRSRFQQGIATELHRRAAADGRTTGDQLGNGIVDGLRAQLETAGDLFDRYLNDLGSDDTKTPKQMKNITAGLRSARLAANALETQLRRTMTEGPSTPRTAAIDELRDRLKDANSRIVKYVEDIGNYSGRSERRLATLRSGLDASRLAAQELEAQLKRTIAQEVKKGVSGNGRDDRNIGSTVGRLFGAGSRNNALNLFGKSLGGVVGLIDKGRKAVGPLFSAFNKGFREAGEGASFLQKAMSGLGEVGLAGGEGLGKVFASVAESGPAAVAAIAALIVSMTIMISIAGALLAIVTALAATLASAVVGALVVAAGAMTAAVAAAGLLTAAFMSMTDAQKKLLKDAFHPLRAEMVGLGQLMIQQMVPAFGVWSSNLQRALALITPLASVMGQAFAQAGTTITAAFTGPGFQALATSLGVWLPSIVQRLSLAFGLFLNGAAGVFSALMPFVNQFAGYLAQVADRFSRWANSANGQNSIVDFTTRALVSLRSLWNAVREFSGFIGDVLFSPEAQQAGNRVFDGLARSFEKFRRNFAKAQADGSVKKWFDDAIKFGKRAMSVVSAFGDAIKELYDSGVLNAVGLVFKFWAEEIQITAAGLKPLVNLLGQVGNMMEWVGKKLGMSGGGVQSTPGGSLFGNFATMINNAKSVLQGAANKQKIPTLKDLIGSGNKALSQTSKGYVNPYVDYANSLIKQGPTSAQQVREAVLSINKQIADALKGAADSTDMAGVRASLLSSIDSMRTAMKSAIDSARSTLNSAAQSLASASTPAEARKALAEVKQAQAGLKAALAEQKRINAVADKLRGQRKVRTGFVNALLAGNTSVHATLAEFALARERLAVKIDAANQKLADAISMRDQYRDQITQSIKTFGDLTTAQAQSIDGVEQALTAGDITNNLQSRLDKIKAFNDNLRILLAQGLSNDAYKQLLDAGVEGGSASAAALVAGGPGAVAQVNGLTQQISDLATSMGSAASSHLYDAGVEAAKGLVDGLLSLSKELDSAAARLGDSIAAAVKRALGIRSPSTVLRGMMNYVGDGAALGLDDQGPKIDSAATRFANRIAVSPEVAAYAAKQGTSPTVSGNGDQRPIDLTVITPTEDPHAVATEVINELTGRL